MSASVLVATPFAAFGELIRMSLEEHGSYQVRLVLTAKEARASFAKTAFQVAIFDSDLEDEPFLPLSTDYLAQSERNRIVVIPPNNNPNHPSLAGLNAHGYLSKPFYLPDLIEIVNRLLTSEETIVAQPEAEELPPPPPQPTTAPPPLLADSLILKNYLESQLSASKAIAALVARNGELFAFAGALTQPNTQELLALIQRYWDLKEKTDLMRFARIGGLPGDYLIYVTEIETAQTAGDFVLMMVFEPRTSLNQVRPQTRHLAQSLATEPVPVAATLPTLVGAKNGTEKKSKPDTGGFVRQYDVPSPTTPPAVAQATLPASDAPSASVPSVNQAELPPLEGEILDDHVDRFDLSLLLGTIPSPDPDTSKPAQPVPSSEWLPGAPAEWQPAAKHVEPPLPVKEPEPSPVSLLHLDVEEEIDPLEDTRPRVIQAINSLNQLEPVSPALSLLNYTCVLIPRLPQHYLTGELADRLSQWVQQFCLAFAWRLEGISIRPEYMQWTVQVAPSVSPANLVSIIRQRTSASIFSTFSHIKDQNPSGDFWAAGYLIINGSQPPAAQLLREYITQTRKRQGVYK